VSLKVNPELIKKIILEENPRVRSDNFNSKTDLFREGILDSYSVIQLVNSLEEKFGIVFDYGDLKAAYFRNIASLIGVLTSKYNVPEGQNSTTNKKTATEPAAKKDNKTKK
jgi:acyl carrier protein